MEIFNELTYINKSSLALGYFDGLHLGHKVVLKNAINIAKETGIKSVVVTFRNHPMTFLTKNPVQQILTLDEKLEILEQTGIDSVVILDFEKFASIKAIDYLENVLVKYFSPLAITTGFNHSFGFNKEGNSDFLRKYREKCNYKYYEIPPFTIDGNLVSCSVIRGMLRFGNFFDANRLLGYNFFLRANVVKGDMIASKLGFPSANIIYPDNKIQIPTGVYFVRVNVGNNLYNGVLNHGFAPTLENNEELKTEVHIINFDKYIYGENIEIEFIAKIRNQMKFENKDKLKAQIIRDIAFAEIYGKFINLHVTFANVKF